MRTRTGAQCVWRSVALASVLALAAGCGGGGGDPVRDTAAVESEVAAQAATVVDMTHITTGKSDGAPSKADPVSMSCDDDNDDSSDRVMVQMWSLYGVDNTTLGKGMADLAANLPKHGWKLVKNGPDSSRARNQEILAVHLATKTQLDATWAKDLDGHEPMITYDVYSRCFRAQDGGGGGDGGGS